MIKSKKYGILTHYYGSNNYGGLLQAYALVYKLNKMNVDAEQICYEMVKDYDDKKNIKYYLSIIKKNISSFLLRKRKKIFKEFEKNIKHSCKVYDSSNIKELEDIYDSIIVGSDQVWNFDWFNEAFFLDFYNKGKYSYAASFGKTKFTNEQLSFLKDKLEKFNYVSIRESSNEKALEDIGIAVTTCLDPTLLLSKDEWNDVIGERYIKEDYVFCYFLTTNSNLRVRAKEYAKKQKLKLVCIPYLLGKFEMMDCFYASKIKNASPFDFINLIKNAKFVMTDSFHACVFSLIFEVDFCVFGRKESPEMNVRINNLLQMFDCCDRMVLDEMSEVKIGKLTINKIKYEEQLSQSMLFLDKVINNEWQYRD